jgi:hypothetical protein
VAAARRAIAGEIRVSRLHPDGSLADTRFASLDAVARWAADGGDMPDGTDTRWAREISTSNARVIFFGRLQEVLKGAVAEELLRLEQAAGIARAVSLALDGDGPFGLDGVRPVDGLGHHPVPRRAE